jgi:hypothetical protein
LRIPGIVTEFGPGSSRIRRALLILLVFLVQSQHFGPESTLGVFEAGSCWVTLRRIQESSNELRPDRRT